MKKILLNCFTISSVIIFILFCVFMNAISGCGNRSMFVIENKSKKPITIEFVYDTLDLKSLVLNQLISKQKTRKNKYQAGYSVVEKLKDSIYNKVDEQYIANYLKDSFPIYFLIPNNLELGNLKDEKYIHNQFQTLPDSFPSLSRWSANDSTLTHKLIHQNTVSINLAPDLALFEYCETCADCTCMHPFFPLFYPSYFLQYNDLTRVDSRLIKIKVMVDELDYVELSPYNFTRIMKMEEIRGHENSAVLRIE